PVCVSFHADSVGGEPRPLCSTGPSGLMPSQIRHAYGFDQVAYDGTGTTIAIVDAYDDPTIANDLHRFDVQFNLPDPVFSKVNQSGGSSMPSANGGWPGRIAPPAYAPHPLTPGR